MSTLSCDILVIGSGAAGATLAATLAESTALSIVVLEKGPYYGAEAFNQRELDMTCLLAQNGARATSDGAIPVAGGECVGGGTTVNYALSFDPIPSVWKRWQTEFGLQAFTLGVEANDYGVQGLSLTRAIREVRKRCDVHSPLDSEVNDNNKLFAQGCRRLGISARKFELNMKGCIGCGFCGQGCAYDAKRGTMVTFLQDALRRGVRLIHHCNVDELVLEGSGRGLRAVGAKATVSPLKPGSRKNSVEPGTLDISAKVVIVSAGAIESPLLLDRSRVPDPYDRLGRGVILHPSLPVAGVFARKLTNYRGITGSYYSDYFYGSHGFMLECLFDHPIGAAFAIPGFGAEHFSLMRRYDQLAGFGAMLVDQPSDENRVTANSANGAPLIRYALSPSDRQRMRIAARSIVEIMFAAGAEQAILTSHEQLTARKDAVFVRPEEAAACERLEFSPNETLLSSAHAQASVKMSEDRRFGLLNSRCEHHEILNLLVCDSSAFPTSCGANPMIAIMSLARYQGQRIAEEWKRYAA